MAKLYRMYATLKNALSLTELSGDLGFGTKPASAEQSGQDGPWWFNRSTWYAAASPLKRLLTL